MRSILDSRLADGSAADDILFAPLVATDIVPLVVDIGARNGMQLLPPAYTKQARLLGFEPNREEFDKLIGGYTDAERYFGKSAPFREVQFEPYAVWSGNGTYEFYITRGAGACTMKGPTLPISDDLFYLYPEGDARRMTSFRDLHTEVVDIVSVECRKLDDLVTANEIVDFLKLDVEGGEADVLSGAEQLLDDGRILSVRSEFQVAPYYESHPLLHEQHRILDAAGFRMIDIDLNHPRYRQGRFALPDAANRGLTLAGDAFYIRDPDRHTLTPHELHRLGLLCLALWYTSFGLFLIERSGLLPVERIEALHSAFQRASMYTAKGRLVRRWAKLPYDVARVANRFRRAVRDR